MVLRSGRTDKAFTGSRAPGVVLTCDHVQLPMGVEPLYCRSCASCGVSEEDARLLKCAGCEMKWYCRCGHHPECLL